MPSDVAGDTQAIRATGSEALGHHGSMGFKVQMACGHNEVLAFGV